jgi:hypothetical protein
VQAKADEESKAFREEQKRLSESVDAQRKLAHEAEIAA